MIKKFNFAIGGSDRRYENGKRDFPVEIIIKFADSYQVNTDYLLDRTDDPTPPQVK